MKKIEILDCTLRDGGYVNNWHFGVDDIKNIIYNLSMANIEYIECGFINNMIQYDINKTIFHDAKNVDELINFQVNSNLALMMKVDEYDIKKLPQLSNSIVNTIRLSFHKKDYNRMIDYAIKIKEKGYRIFIQPTIIMGYNTHELKTLLKTCREIIKPDGLAIVDTLGEMSSNNIKYFTELFDNTLELNTKLLFHGHNNFQQAFSNAITFIENSNEGRSIIIDTSLMGMGRDAGNVCTELMTGYLNKYYDLHYNYDNILSIIDEVIYSCYKQNFDWGYSPIFMLNARNRVHPRYARFFRNSIPNIKLCDLDKLLICIPIDEREEFNNDIAVKILNKCYKRKYIDV